MALESQAINAVQGRFLDERGHLTVTGNPDMDLARRLMHGPEYHRAKAAIMAPLHDFLARVADRRPGDAAEASR